MKMDAYGKNVIIIVITCYKQQFFYFSFKFFGESIKTLLFLPWML